MDTPLTTPEVAAKLETLTAQVALLVERQQKQGELVDAVLPIAKEVMKTASARLDSLEKRGYFAFGSELVAIGQKIVESYSPQDVRQLGEAITVILDTVRALTQPQVLRVVGEVSEALSSADKAQPLGLVGFVRATRSDDVQRGMGVFLEVLRKVGVGAEALSARQVEADSRHEKLAKLLGPSKGRKALGIERPPAAAPVAPRAPPAAPAAVVPTVIDGIAFKPDGSLADASQWTKELGETIAGMHGAAMTPRHWEVVTWARNDYLATKASPNIRRITLGMSIATRDVYALFPKAPGRTVARIAGIPKPAGCL